MGNSTGSTMYMFGAVIVIYIVGVLIIRDISGLRKKENRKETKSSEEVMNNGKYHYYTDRDRAAWICAERHIQAYEGGKPVLRWRRWKHCP